MAWRTAHGDAVRVPQGSCLTELMEGASDMTGDAALGPPPGVAPAVPTTARVYDALLGGTTNFEADRRAAEVFRATSRRRGNAPG